MNFVISGSPLAEALAAGLLAKPDAVLRPRQELLSAGLAVTEGWLQNETRLEWVRPEAGALCGIRFRPEVGDEVVAAFWDGLAAHELQLASGEWFGESRRVMRLGFGYLPLEGLRQALDAVTRALDLAERAAERCSNRWVTSGSTPRGCYGPHS
jgi:DNA-binding transcriptional MocR family regulator